MLPLPSLKVPELLVRVVVPEQYDSGIDDEVYEALHPVLVTEPSDVNLINILPPVEVMGSGIDVPENSPNNVVDVVKPSKTLT